MSFSLKEVPYNHAWNAPNAILAKYISGIYPTKPGWKEFVVKPHLVNFKFIKQTVPSIQGDINLEINKNEELSLVLDSPNGTGAIVYIPNDTEYTSVIVNGRNVWNKNGKAENIENLSYLGEESDYVVFKILSGGKWTFKAKK